MQTHTSTTLLESLKDPANREVWGRFDARYRPIITAFARKLGMDELAAGEVAQATLAEFVKSYREGKYVRGRGRLSSWIIGIAQNLVFSARRDVARHPARGESAFVAIPGEAALTQLWESQRQEVVFADALATLRARSRADERTLRAFELFALRGVPADAVAKECGMTTPQVYVAKNRMTSTLRRIVEEIEAAYQEDE